MTEKKQLDYVISAVGMMGVFTPDHEAFWYPEYKKMTLSLMESLNKRIAETCHNTKPLVSTLYNAYTEKNHVDEFKRLENLGSASVYADSGGLQIVTAGKTITTDIKNQIYKTQTYADYAMCFDVIPLSSVSLTRTRNERSNVGNKIFHSEKHRDAAFATGDNVKAQASFFRTVGAKTKVIIIVQGNDIQDMVEYFKNITTRLDDVDYDNIGGLAIADTCMGNGELESIKMLVAAKEISKICHPNIKKHLHVLGVGSIYRMRPILYLLKSGYLSAFERVSYDSSSHTSTFQYGLLKVNGTCTSIGSTKTFAVDKHFRNVYNLFHDTFARYVSEDKFIDSIFTTDPQADWKYSTIKNRVIESGDPDVIIPSLLCNAAHTYYQIHNFITNLDKVMLDEFGILNDSNMNEYTKMRPINSLLSIDTDEKMKDWLSFNSSSIKTKSIKRDTELATLEGFE
jgi:hypothetical protein